MNDFMDSSVTNDEIKKITKKYLIDLLNSVFFSKMVYWDGADQFHELPILYTQDDLGNRVEQRGALLVHKVYRKALCLLITLSDNTNQSVCYRMFSLKESITLDLPKICLPFSGLDLDLSISDLNIGLQDSSAYSFHNNLNVDGEISKEKLFSLLNFLTESDIIAYENPQMFENMLKDIASFPPVSSDHHYSPVFSLPEKD